MTNTRYILAILVVLALVGCEAFSPKQDVEQSVRHDAPTSQPVGHDQSTVAPSLAGTGNVAVTSQLPSSAVILVSSIGGVMALVTMVDRFWSHRREMTRLTMAKADVPGFFRKLRAAWQDEPPDTQ
jgi:hypothetical protein